MANEIEECIIFAKGILEKANAEIKSQKNINTAVISIFETKVINEGIL